MKLAIIGSRNIADYGLLKILMKSLCKKHNITKIVSGGAKGADTLAKRYAEEKDVLLWKA